MSKQQVSSITCYDSGGFDMKFRVIWKDSDNRTKRSGWTPYASVGKSKTMDLTTLSLSEGMECWPEVKAAGGNSNESSDKVLYAPNSSNNATYQVTGVAWSHHAHLDG